MDKLVLLAYKPTSIGSKKMAQALNVERLTIDSSFRPEERTTVINWGRGDWPLWKDNVFGWINNPPAVLRAIDKGDAFLWMKRAGVPIPEYTESIEQARAWIGEGHIVLCRQELQGFEGRGIVVARKAEELVPARMYVKYVKKVYEYRVHVMNGEAFYANIKRQTADPKVEKPDPLVRSGPNGWIFYHMDELPSKAVCDACVAAVQALGLDFGGVDVGESKDGTATVYEVNTAPEVGPNTIAAYMAAFKRNYGQHKNNENVPIGNLQLAAGS